MSDLSRIIADSVSINTCTNSTIDEDFHKAQVFNVFGTEPPDDKVFEGALGIYGDFHRYTKLANQGK